jgi:WXG100 family type VII secretion target
MANFSQVNYDETSSFAKQFHNDGDDITQLFSDTRQRMQALRNEWIGEAADSFYEEMETELLPAIQKVARALFLSEDILNKIMRIIHDADEETAASFKSGLDSDFGAGLFSQLGAGVLGGILGGAAAGADFGASKFEEALGGDQSGTGLGGAEGGDTPQPVGEAADDTRPMGPPLSPEDSSPLEEPQETQPETAAGGGGGGGGGGSSQGLEGDLKGLGTGIGGQPQQVGVMGGGPAPMPDHVYGGPSEGASGGGSSQAGPAGGTGGGGEQSGGGGGAAAGVAGVAGAAAAGGAAKVLKGKNDKSDDSG